MHLHLRVILEVPLLLKTAILSVCTPTTALDSSLILDSRRIVALRNTLYWTSFVAKAVNINQMWKLKKKNPGQCFTGVLLQNVQVMIYLKPYQLSFSVCDFN